MACAESSGTHRVQLWATSALFGANAISIFALNRLKAKGHRCEWSWGARRAAFWGCVATSCSASMWLDSRYAIGRQFLNVKAYVFGFPLGLLDLYFSNCSQGVPAFTSLASAGLWCCTWVLRSLGVERFVPGGGARIVQDFSPVSMAKELGRFYLGLPFIGMFGDLIFSPVHRVGHHPKLYKYNHKKHHEYTNNLTSLVLYYGNFLDDFMMPACVALGHFLYEKLAASCGLAGCVISNFTTYMLVMNALLAHAHDIRCARLLAPLPDHLNFVAYHYVHHLNPDKNFGLTKPSDVIWDKLLGKDTISSYEKELQRQLERKK